MVVMNGLSDMSNIKPSKSSPASDTPVPAVISLLLPTRGRPALAERFFRSVVEMSACPSVVEIILYVDDDDTESHRLDTQGVRVKKIFGPRRTMGEYNSQCLKRATGDIIILANDDLVIRTKGWDEQVRATHRSYPDGIYLAWGNDLFKGRKISTFPILSRRTCEILVEPYPRAYRGAFIDTHLFDIFKRVEKKAPGRVRYLHDVIFDHLHYRQGKSEMDETYSQRGRFDDDPTFLALVEARQAAAQRLLAVVAGEDVPEFEPTDCVEVSPKNLLAAMSFFSKQLLLDRGLPLRWRVWLWVNFLGRHMAARGWLRPFVN